MLHCFVAEQKKRANATQTDNISDFLLMVHNETREQQMEKILSNLFDLQKMQNNVPEDKDK